MVLKTKLWRFKMSTYFLGLEQMIAAVHGHPHAVVVTQTAQTLLAYFFIVQQKYVIF